MCEGFAYAHELTEVKSIANLKTILANVPGECLLTTGLMHDCVSGRVINQLWETIVAENFDKLQINSISPDSVRNVASTANTGD